MDPTWTDWDPVMVAEYLASVEEPEPEQSLVLEMRRGALDSEWLRVDVSGRFLG
jgi:hypothetical protein